MAQTFHDRGDGALRRRLAGAAAGGLLVLTLALAACGGGGSADGTTGGAPPAPAPSPPAPPAPPVTEAPRITTPPATTTVTAGQTASFTVVAAGSTPLVYQWLRDGQAIVGANAASYTTPATVLGDSGAAFSVRVSNTAGNATSAAAVLTVQAPPPVLGITTPPQAVAVPAGQTATFSVVATGVAPLAYQWRRDGAAIAGATAASYTTPATTLADSGAVFSVRVSDGSGSVDSAGVVLTVNPAAVASALSCSVTGSHTLARQADGTVWAWGRNEYGQLGDGTLADRATAAPIPGVAGAAAVFAGAKHSLFLGADGQVHGVGSDRMGELGTGAAATTGLRSSVVAGTAIGTALTLAAGSGVSLLDPGTTAVVLPDGTVKAWGASPAFGDAMLRGGAAGLVYTGFPAAAAVEASDSGALIVVGRDGTLWSTGTNLRTLGDSVSIADNTAVQMPGIDNVESVAMGQGFAVVLKRDGTVWTWGTGALGYAVAPGTVVRTPTAVPGLASIVRVAASATMAMALRSDGTLYTWGRNVEGQLGLGWGSPDAVVTPTAVTTTGPVRDLCAGWLHAVFALEDGSVWAAGDNRWKQLGNASAPLNSRPPVRVEGLTLLP